MLCALACAAPPQQPTSAHDDPWDRVSVTVDVAPGVWPNVLGEGAFEVVVEAGEALDSQALRMTPLTQEEPAVLPRSVRAGRTVQGAHRVTATFEWSDLVAAGLADHTRVALRTQAVSGATAEGSDLILSSDRPFLRLSRPSGRHPVGTARVLVHDLSRAETLSVDEGSARDFLTRVWYPAEVDGNRPGAYHLSVDEAAYLTGAWGLPEGYFDTVFRRVHTGAPAADPRPERQAWPVLILSPPWGTPIASMSWFAAEAASQGWVVLGLAHSYADTPVLLGGELVISPTIDDPSLGETLAVWQGDAATVRADLMGLLSGIEGLTDHLDIDAVGWVGFGHGGSAVAAGCVEDGPFAACVAVDDGVRPLSAVPFLQLVTGQLNAGQLQGLASAQGPGWAFELPDSTSEVWTDLSLQGPLLAAVQAELSVEPGSEPPDVVHRAAVSTMLDFFDHTLRGGSGNLVGGCGLDVLR
jgi:hypothetical protein